MSNTGLIKQVSGARVSTSAKVNYTPISHNVTVCKALCPVLCSFLLYHQGSSGTSGHGSTGTLGVCCGVWPQEVGCESSDIFFFSFIPYLRFSCPFFTFFFSLRFTLLISLYNFFPTFLSFFFFLSFILRIWCLFHGCSKTLGPGKFEGWVVPCNALGVLWSFYHHQYWLFFTICAALAFSVGSNQIGWALVLMGMSETWVPRSLSLRSLLVYNWSLVLIWYCYVVSVMADPCVHVYFPYFRYIKA